MIRMGNKREQVLKRMVREYVRSARPVPSSAIAGKSGPGFSPATIRNYYAEFEELGLVFQPHPSAGRVPTDLGFRYFVDNLTRPEILDQEQAPGIRQFFERDAAGIEDVTRHAPRLLSRISRQLALMVGPKLDQSRLREIHFLRLDPTRLIAIFIFQGELVENRILRDKDKLSGADLHRLSGYLNQVGRGKTLLELRNYLLEELKAQGRNQNRQTRRLFEFSEEIIRGQVRAEINIEGQSNLANNPEFNAPEKLEEVLRLLEDQQILLELMEQTLSGTGANVIIGREHPFPQMRELAMITAGYFNRAGKPAGKVAVIGPKRMDYENLIPLVSYMARMMSEFLRMH